MSATREYLGWLFQDAGRVELRHQVNRRWQTSWHESPDSLLATARGLAGEGNLFTSIHHTATDKLIEPITNHDVDRYCRLFFDFDPERPAGTASTDEELGWAQARAEGVREYLAINGWETPAYAMSGNGFHLMYRTALPNTEEVRDMLRYIYTGLHHRNTDDVVSFDRSVRNPGRIATLYGSIKRKGQPTDERPHRQSRILIPPKWRQVSLYQVERLANQYAREQKPKVITGGLEHQQANVSGGKGDYATLDVVAWFSSHGLYVGHLHSHLHGVICPWSDEHSTASPEDGGDCIIFETDGSWAGFHCKHSHCSDRTIRDVIALLGDADNFCAQTYAGVES